MITNFNEYQEATMQTAIYPNIGNNIVYPTLGLNGEAGEVAEKVKKILRDKDGIISDDDRGELKKELGDVLWYLSMLCNELGLQMSKVADFNIKKLQDRKNRNKIKGSGDNR